MDGLEVRFSEAAQKAYLTGMNPKDIEECLQKAEAEDAKTPWRSDAVGKVQEWIKGQTLNWVALVDSRLRLSKGEKVEAGQVEDATNGFYHNFDRIQRYKRLGNIMATLAYYALKSPFLHK